MFENVKNIIDEWDPIDLITMNSPSDEYDTEIRHILDKIDSNINEKELSLIIYNLFLEEFGDDDFHKTKEDCLEIATKIINELEMYN